MTEGRTHAEFLEELGASSEAVTRVAHWLSHQRGVPVVLRPTFHAPTFEQRGDYVDDGDLEVLLRVEVKRRSLAFTGKADYPFPTAIVDACPNFDGKRPKPFAYLLLNEAMDAALFVDVAHTRPQWKRAEFVDGRNRIPQPFYVCPVERLGEVKL